MKAITTQGQISEDGVLRLAVLCDLQPGLAEVVLVVQHADTATSTETCPPYRSLHGVWAEKLPDIDVETNLQEMHRQWKNTLEVGE